MNKRQFEEMMRVARDIVRSAEEGSDISPLTIEWAQTLITNNPFKFRQSPLQADIEALFNMPGTGLTAVEIQERLGRRSPSVIQAINTMVRNGKLHRLFWHHRSRYFGSAVEMEAGRAAFDAERAAWRPTTWKEPKPPKPPKPPKVPKPPKPLKTIAEMATSIVARKQTAFMPPNLNFLPGRRTVLDSGDAFRPDNAPVPIQVVPHRADTRYTVDAPAPGGFLDEWKRLRGEST